MMEEQQEPPVTEQREAPISIRRGPLPQEPPPEKPARTFEPLPGFRPVAVGERFSRPSSALLTVARANLRFHMEKAPPSQSLQSLEQISLMELTARKFDLPPMKQEAAQYVSALYRQLNKNNLLEPSTDFVAE